MKKLAFLVTCLLLSRVISAQEFAPQLWSNVAVGKQISQKWRAGGEVSYNTIFTDIFKWREFALSGAASYRYKPWLSFNTSLDFSLVNQTELLSSSEIRPSVGVMFIAFTGKKYALTNNTRLQLRFFHYSDDTKNSTGRLRNRTNFIYSLNQSSAADRSNWLVLFSFEAFYNFDDDTRERFLNLLRGKFGVLHRFEKNWTLDFGVLIQNARNNTDKDSPIVLPIEPPITRYIFEWRLVFEIPGRK